MTESLFKFKLSISNDIRSLVIILNVNSFQTFMRNGTLCTEQLMKKSNNMVNSVQEEFEQIFRLKFKSFDSNMGLIFLLYAHFYCLILYLKLFINIFNIFLLYFCFFQNLSLPDGVNIHFNLSTQERKEGRSL